MVVTPRPTRDDIKFKIKGRRAEGVAPYNFKTGRRILRSRSE